MFEEVRRYIDNNNLIKKSDRILVALSGGPDSVALLHILLKLKKNYNIEIGAAHINHSLRGEASDGDEVFVQELGKKYYFDIYTKKIDVRKYAKDNNIGEEEAGREIRYDFFHKICKKYKYNKIATAHNLDDNIETFLFRLMRGTSLEGLSAIPVKRDNIIRPILNQKKKDILYFLNSNRLSYRIDESNNETDYTRNKIRLNLIPYIEKEFNANFVDCLYPLINEIDGVNSYIKKDIEEAVQNDYLDIKVLLSYDEVIRKKIFRNYMEKYPVEISRKKIDSIEDIIFSEGYKEIDLGQGYFFVKEYEKMYIRKENKKISNKNKIALEINGKIMYNGYRIESKLVDNIPKKGKFYYFDYDKIDKNIFVRSRKEGDRFIPFGMKNNKKLKNFFIDTKIEREKREIMPIIVSGTDIILVGNLRSANLFKVDKNTKKILLLKVEEVEVNGK